MSAGSPAFGAHAHGRAPGFGVGKETIGVAGVALAVFSFGCGPVVIRAITADAAAIAFFRMWMSLPMLWVLTRLSGGRTSWPVLRIAFVPAVVFAVSLVCGFEAIKRTSIANASLVPALQPVLVMAVASRYGDRVRPRDVLLGVLAMAGVATVVTSGGRTSGAHRSGDALALVGLVLFTMFFLSVKRVRTAGVPAVEFTFAVMIWATVVITPWALFATKGLGQVGGDDWWLLLVLTVGNAVLGHTVLSWAHRYVPVSMSSVLTLLTPVVSMTGAWLVHHQKLNGLQMVGCAVVLLALAVLLVQRRMDVGVPAGDEALGPV